MAGARIRSFREFWPFYLGQHRQRLTRRLHFLGTGLAAACAILAVWGRRPWLLLAGLVGSYGFAWAGHFFVERNRPATFEYPLWSFAAEWKMWALMMTGRLGRELHRHGIDPL